MDTYSNNDVLELKKEIEMLKRQLKSSVDCLKVCNKLSKTTTAAYEITIDIMKSKCTCQKK